MYKVLKTQLRYYPHALLLLADMTTGERRWWCFGRQHEEDLCEDYHTKDLAGAVLIDLPRNGGWIDEKEIEML